MLPLRLPHYEGEPTDIISHLYVPTRNRVLDDISRATGQRLLELTSAAVRRGAGGHDHRGAQSIDGRAISQAKQSLPHTGVLEKFDNDGNYAIYAVRNGWTRCLLSIQECVAFAHLPNQGRSREQRALG